jgi:hypothetical protein
MNRLVGGSIFLGAFLTIVAAPAVFAEASVCEIKVKVDKATGQRVAESLHIEHHNFDPGHLNDLWETLFGVMGPDMSVDDLLTLQTKQTVTWEAGTLEMGGTMKLKVKTDKKDPMLKEIKIEKVGKKDGITIFVSGTGGVNPNLADSGWHEVKIKDMDEVTVTFGTDTVTGFLKELKVKLDRDSTVGMPMVREFKLKIKVETLIPDIKIGFVTSVIVDVPETIVTALAETEYEEKVKDKPETLGGHTEAEYDRADGAVTDGVDIASLADGKNDQLKERKGSCVVSPEQLFVYSEMFKAGVSYSAGSPQWDNWDTFRAGLDTGVHSFTTVTFSGSNSPGNFTCSNPGVVAQIADALRDEHNLLAVACDGHTWDVTATACGGALGVDNLACNFCSDLNAIRPHIGTDDWGGLGSPSCPSRPDQTLTLTFN